jgi:hypothetical protein
MSGNRFFLGKKLHPLPGRKIVIISDRLALPAGRNLPGFGGRHQLPADAQQLLAHLF